MKLGIAHTIFLAGFFLILTVDSGDVYACGSNSFGQLGLGHQQAELLPQKISGLAKESVVKIASGHHSAAINKQGELFIWGTGAFGQQLSPVKVIYALLMAGGLPEVQIDRRRDWRVVRGGARRERVPLVVGVQHAGRVGARR